MKKVVIGLILAVAATSSFADTEAECIEKGRGYEKEAEVTVKPSVIVRCQRTPEAFSFFKPFCVNYAKRDQVRREKASDPDMLKTLEKIWKEEAKKYPVCK